MMPYHSKASLAKDLSLKTFKMDSNLNAHKRLNILKDDSFKEIS